MVVAKLYILVHFILRKFVLICFLWISWHSPDFWWNINPPKPQNLPLLNPTSKCSPSGLWGQFVQPVSFPRFICILHVHNNPIGPAVWPHFQEFWIVDPIKPPKMSPRRIVGRIVFSLCPFPRWIHRRVPNLVPIGPAVWQLPKTFEFVIP